MKRALRVLLLRAAAGLIWAYTRWPPIDDVETGRTPEYAELQPRAYRAGEAEVLAAAKDAVARLPRWRYVGSGSGPGGGEIRALRTTLFVFEHDVTVRIKREGGRTRVSVRSRSRIGPVDFGQNARNIRELLAELDRALR